MSYVKQAYKSTIGKQFPTDLMLGYPFFLCYGHCVREVENMEGGFAAHAHVKTYYGATVIYANRIAVNRVTSSGLQMHEAC
ncbi:MAG: hypothetical protein ACXV47_06455 [Halobacteriota archaeon]